jgi:hypothetical protein
VLAVTIGLLRLEHPGAVPAICRFHGLTIYVYFRDHQPPHFHVRSGLGDASVVIRTGRVVGVLPVKERALVDRWRKEHLMELHFNWQRAARHEPLHEIEAPE